MMRYAGSILAITILLSPALTLASSPLTLRPIEAGECGIFVKDANANTPEAPHHSLIAHDALSDGAIRIALPEGEQILRLTQSTPEPQSRGESYQRVYANPKGSLSLALQFIGYCGPHTLEGKPESCESARYTGTMDVDFPPRSARYSVIVNDGC